MRWSDYNPVVYQIVWLVLAVMFGLTGDLTLSAAALVCSNVWGAASYVADRVKETTK